MSPLLNLLFQFNLYTHCDLSQAIGTVNPFSRVLVFSSLLTIYGKNIGYIMTGNGGKASHLSTHNTYMLHNSAKKLV